MSMDSQEFLRCEWCNKDRPRVLFPKEAPSKQWDPWMCQACLDGTKECRRKIYIRSRYKKRDPLDTVTRRAKVLRDQAEKRSRDHGVPFTLTQSWVKARLVAGRCELTGLPFDFSHIQSGSGYRSNFCPSIERVQAHLGYTPDNCRVVVWIYNAAKGTGSHEDVVRFAEALMARSSRPHLKVVA
jgi:hypothetical protein